MRAMYWVGVFLACAVTASVAGIVPSSFNYQGVLRGGSGELLPAGTKNVEFRLYSVPTEGSALWGRGYAVMLDSNGLFNVTLTDGSGSPVSDPSAAGTVIPQVIATHSTLYLGVWVIGNTEIVPRQQLLSVPYALMAGDVKQSSGDLQVMNNLTVMGSISARQTIQVNQTLMVGNATLAATPTGVLQVPALNVGGNATVLGRIQDKTGDIMPVGSVLPFAGATIPPGWLLCDGRLVPRATYPELYSAISTNYGIGDGSLTFALPDLLGRTAIGAGKGSGLINRPLGARGIGEENHTLNGDEIPSHQHDITTSSSMSSYAAVASGANHWKGTTAGKTALNGGGGSHNNMQPSLPLNYIIKY